MTNIEIQNLIKESGINTILTISFFICQEINDRFDKMYEKYAKDNVLTLLYPLSPLGLIMKGKTSNIISVKKYDDMKDGWYKIICENGDTERLTRIDGNNMSIKTEIIEQFENMEKKIKYEEEKAKPIHFENEDIIITDPCYVIKHNPYKYPTYEDYGLSMETMGKKFVDFTDEEKEKYEKYDNDPYFKWDKEHDEWTDCEYGDNMEVLGIKNYICRNTIYGDWSCTTYNTDTNEEIGQFCADAGLVAVFSLKEVLDYNPDFDYHENRKWTTTLIKNFTGDVRFEVREERGVWEDDTQYHKKGEEWVEKYVVVIGEGNINFIGTQTGL